MRLGYKVTPVFQAIELDIDAAKDDYTGLVRIELEVWEHVNAFRLHAEDMTLNKVVLRGAAGPLDVSHAKGEKGLITLTAKAPLDPGRYQLLIDFSNDFNRKADSLYKVEHGGRSYTFTQFEVDSAREAFPCWDEPDFKIPFQVTLTVPHGHLAVSNAPVESVSRTEAGKRIVFQRTRPMPTYLLAVATGPFETVAVPGMSVPGRIITATGQIRLAGEAVRITPPLLRALEDYFERPYPYKKLDQIAAPEFLFGAMENVGAIVYRDNRLLVDPEAATFYRRRRVAAVVAHELSHMWFGNLVTLKWWDDIWLNESFADWMGTRVTDFVYPEFQYSLTEVQHQQKAMLIDALPSAKPIRRTVLVRDGFGGLFDVLSYNKGKAVLSMVENWMGAEIFREGVLTYMEEYQWKNATRDDFWKSLSKAAGNDVVAVMETFINQPGVPLVRVETLRGGRIRLTQERFANYGAQMRGNPLWRIPVHLRYSDGQNTYDRQILLNEREQTFKLETKRHPLWIHVNNDEYGYYRWTAPADMLEIMARDSESILTIRERVGFIDNISALLDLGLLSGKDYLRIIGFFAQDPVPEVLSVLADTVNKVYDDFIDPELEETFAAYVRVTLKPTLEKIGLEHRHGEKDNVSSLRSQLLYLLGDKGKDPEVLDYLKTLARKYLENPRQVDPSLAGVSLALSAIDGDVELFETYRDKFETVSTPVERSRYLNALGYFRRPEIRKIALLYSLEGGPRPHEFLNIARTLAGSSPIYREEVFNWLISNYDRILEKSPRWYQDDFPWFVNGPSLTLLNRAEDFFNNPLHLQPGQQNELAKVADKVRLRVKIREKEGAAIIEYLLGIEAGY